MTISDEFPSLIAEIGLNHLGSVSTAESLVRGSIASGFDSVKFQYRARGNSYSSVSQIGDELIAEELNRSYLDPGEIVKLASLAKSIGAKSGISFFNVADVQDFDALDLRKFDFFKVPSSELENSSLISFFLQLGKPVLISTGMHGTKKSVFELKKYLEFSNWLPMHCVSNYPTSLENANLGRIKSLSDNLGRDAGYSSHDADWKVCLVALGAGATFLERHVTSDRTLKGLDQSSSSTLDELKQISHFWNARKRLMASEADPNSGSIINLQNLGRSFYAVRKINPGEAIRAEDFVYRPPKLGLGYADFNASKGRKLIHSLETGEALSYAHFERSDDTFSSEALGDLNVALPVRPADYESIRDRFDLGAYEFHLSSGDVELLPDDMNRLKNDKWAIHLPDYLNVDSLLDPFDPNPEIASESRKVIDKILTFGSKIAQASGREIPVVASFTCPHLSEAEYFDRFQSTFSSHREDGVIVSLQWMPPFAWYFGGSVEIKRNTSIEDAHALSRTAIPLTLDSSHLLMGANYTGFSPYEITELLRENIIHIHLSDAHGIDGEGAPFSSSSPNNDFMDFLLRTFASMKTLEVWQGHLNRYAGFAGALEWVSSRK